MIEHKNLTSNGAAKKACAVRFAPQSIVVCVDFALVTPLPGEIPVLNWLPLSKPDM